MLIDKFRKRKAKSKFRTNQNFYLTKKSFCDRILSVSLLIHYYFLPINRMRVWRNEQHLLRSTNVSVRVRSEHASEVADCVRFSLNLSGTKIIEINNTDNLILYYAGVAELADA